MAHVGFLKEGSLACHLLYKAETPTRPPKGWICHPPACLPVYVLPIYLSSITCHLSVSSTYSLSIISIYRLSLSSTYLSFIY